MLIYAKVGRAIMYAAGVIASLAYTSVSFPVFASVPSSSRSGSVAPLSTKDLKSLSPENVDLRVRKDLASLIVSTDKSEWPKLRRINHITMLTHPYGTFIQNLCRRDLIELKYAPKSEVSNYSDQLLEPYGIESRAQYHVIGLPLVEGPQQPSLAFPLNVSCRAVSDGDKTTWFEAPDIKDAASAVNFFQEALAQVRAGSLQFNPCNIEGGSKKCTDLALRAASVDMIKSYSACEPTTRATCVNFYLSSMLVVTVSGRRVDDDISAQRVSSVSVGSYVVVD